MESIVNNSAFPPSPVAIELAEWAAVREKRGRLMLESDYTQVADSPLSEAQRSAVAVYRQKLRDVPQGVGDPFVVVWPEKPDFLE